MNHGYGNRRGQRGGGRRFGDGGSRWDGGAGSSGGYTRSSEWDSREERGHGGERRGGGGGGGGGGGRGKHPPHLKGREIGLWYAKYGGIKRSEAERKSRAVVQMDEQREQHITQLLNSVQRDADRDAHPSTSQSWRGKEEPSGHSYFDGDDPPEPQNIVKVPKIEPKEEKQENEDELGASVKEELDDTDLEYLFQDVVRIPSLDEELKKDLQKKKDNARYLDMLKFREKLPSYGMREELVRLINANQVLVISGETGCGKTTQVTQFILDDFIERGMGSLCRVVCTQPRRISAISVAERVAAERAESVGDGKSSGYQIRLQWYSDSTTDALEMMDDDDKINLQLIVALIRHIVMKEDALSQKASSALVVILQVTLWVLFLPGWDNISTLNDLLTADQIFKSDRFIIIPLHSLMPTVSQTQVFKKPPPGVRKIVIATNIAETSITIDDVVYVIDGGKIKETHFDTQNNIRTMTAEWVSLANAKQRKGRAGRVSPGKCYHLYNGLRASLLDNYQLPEIQRTPLEELCLQIKILKLGPIASFLRKTMDPPADKAIELAITHLVDLNALDRNEELTPLGFHLARMPVEPHIGKMILFGALLGCLDPVLTIAASLGFKDPFFIPLGKEKIADQRRKILSLNSRSDHLTIVNAFWGWEDAKKKGSRFEKEYCWDNFLSANTLQMLQNMKGQFAEHLLAAGFVNSKDPKDPSSNVNSENEKLIKAVIVAGLYPKVAKIRPNHSKKRPMPVKVYTKADGKVCIHPKSVNAEETQFHYTWLIYHLKMKTTSVRTFLICPKVRLSTLANKIVPNKLTHTHTLMQCSFTHFKGKDYCI
ncbi:ATP-dependent DNA/RNA helicase DHX36 [Sinocyclocheilus grahami]|uniref:ATP-dependent DNA/RNA helicase DHX36 n=1 Tax=Sinocyclocheilus grahami TaxID=75366 RepID=UPI0007ACA089|nr:PREDICTED: ATP-dependent RNA helicase DHX36 [Sinocyclocheilus grahami]